jgi:hypothetical protein
MPGKAIHHGIYAAKGNFGDLIAHDLNVKTATVQQCQKKCEENPKCKGYSFRKFAYPFVCYLHNSVDIKYAAQAAKNGGFDSGVCVNDPGFPFAAQNNKPCRVSCPCPVFGFEPTVPFSTNVKGENHCGSKRGMGVICRKTDGSGHWTQPNGCTRKGSFPFALDATSGKNCQAYCPEKAKFQVVVDGNNFNAAKQAALANNVAKLLGVDAKFVKVVIGNIGSRRLLAGKLTVTIIVELPASQVKSEIEKVESDPAAFTAATGAEYVAHHDASIQKKAVCKSTKCTYGNGYTTVAFKKASKEKWHCEKSGAGCKCVCDQSFKCELRHVAASGYRFSSYHC